ncbi:hypothetical protein CISG_03847 [Coccidioides immitis RMSCC 3703]|uniref:Uncharacterized protein n=1 Tax=Coccidioides immitis RMSCC 3703 TaxID=454286 RepID=A0A0J8QN66_COCIT|nr:hypothetical protein CISG_03847 [Coccidioides immitis RMSCC 3703]
MASKISHFQKQVVALLGRAIKYRRFSSTPRLRQIEDISTLPDRIFPRYQGNPKDKDLPTLQWPVPPRNIHLVRKKEHGRDSICD